LCAAAMTRMGTVRLFVPAHLAVLTVPVCIHQD
jgi:hypothetical protein